MCLEHEVKPDLGILWSVTSECGLHSEGTDEEIIATLISLDGHIFTLPSTEERDILKELFSRITTLSTTTEWPVVADTYVDRILVPMMDHFAKARDLTGFIRHWYEQLVAFDALLSERKPKDELPHLGAWEDDALLKKLKGVMEASLTSEQIVSLLDWVQEQTGNPGPALVVMDAITGAIITEETIESAKLYLWALPWTVAQKSVSERYKRRQSRIITHMIDTCTLEYYDKLWTAHPDISKQFISIGGALTEPTTLAEIFKSAASQYTLVSMLNSDLLSEELITPLKKMLRKKFLGEAIHWFQSSGKDAVKEHRRTSIDVNLKTQDLVYSLAKTILVDYPKFVK
jgi:nucleolar pre-ribosomal-associated protein 2